MINLLIFLLLLFPPGRVSRRNIGEHSSDGEALAVVWAIRVAMFLFLFIIPICLDYFLSEGRFIFFSISFFRPASWQSRSFPPAQPWAYIDTQAHDGEGALRLLHLGVSFFFLHPTSDEQTIVCSSLTHAPPPPRPPFNQISQCFLLFLYTHSLQLELGRKDNIRAQNCSDRKSQTNAQRNHAVSNPRTVVGPPCQGRGDP